VATGCNHAIIGPDLRSLWTIYHCKQNGSGFRRLCLDKLSFDTKTGDLISTGPTWTSQDNPTTPSWSDDFRRNDIGPNWETLNGKWSIKPEGFVTAEATSKYAELLCRLNTTNKLYAEFNIKPRRSQSATRPSCGLMIRDENRGTYYLALDPDAKTLSLLDTPNGTPYRTTKASAKIPASIDLYAWHAIRVESQSGRMKVFMDDIKLIDTGMPELTGRPGFAANNCSADFGWFGFSR
jgi:hypothetical protein